MWPYLIALCIYFAACLVAYYLLKTRVLGGCNELITRLGSKSARVLLVVAHPDDECMFFGPVISCMSAEPEGCHNLFVLCLSDGL